MIEGLPIRLPSYPSRNAALGNLENCALDHRAKKCLLVWKNDRVDHVDDAV